MMASAASLVDTIRRCRLLEGPRLVELAEHLLARYPDPRVLARELIQRDWLTPFQINQIARGHGPQLCFGRYILLNRLGKGGMGRVYKARRQDDGRVIVLKILRKRYVSHPLALQRFSREGQTVTQLAHSNIVRALETGHVGATPFLAMEFVEGTDLSRLVEQRGRLPIGEACTYAHQAALGLQHAHERGVIHRDIKPRNLLVAIAIGERERPLGMLKILDFGLALLERETEESSRLTQTGRRVGTVEYIAPEQEVNCRDADPRSDIYSLGCSLYFALAGRPPLLLDASLRASGSPQVSWEAPPVQCFRPEVPPALSAVLVRMLARDPASRYQTAAAAAAALLSFGIAPRPAVGQPSSVLNENELAPLRESAESTPGAVAPPAVRYGLVSSSPPWHQLRLALGLAGLGILLAIVLLLAWRPSAPTPSGTERRMRDRKSHETPPVTPRDGTKPKKKEEVEDPPAETEKNGQNTIKKKAEEVEDPPADGNGKPIKKKKQEVEDETRFDDRRRLGYLAIGDLAGVKPHQHGVRSRLWGTFGKQNPRLLDFTGRKAATTFSLRKPQLEHLALPLAFRPKRGEPPLGANLTALGVVAKKK